MKLLIALLFAFFVLVSCYPKPNQHPDNLNNPHADWGCNDFIPSYKEESSIPYPTPGNDWEGRLERGYRCRNSWGPGGEEQLYQTGKYNFWIDGNGNGKAESCCYPRTGPWYCVQGDKFDNGKEGMSNVADRTCTACNENEHTIPGPHTSTECIADTITQCNGGYGLDNGGKQEDSSCVLCADNQIVPSTVHSEPCQDDWIQTCQFGYKYNSGGNTGQASCEQCPANSISPGGKFSSCVAKTVYSCDPGEGFNNTEYDGDNTCTDCSSYSTVPNSFFSPGGTVGCTSKTTCPPGSGRSSSQTAEQSVVDTLCVPCVDSFSPVDSLDACQAYAETGSSCTSKNQGLVDGTNTTDSSCETCTDWNDGVYCKPFSVDLVACRAQTKGFVPGTSTTDSYCEECTYWYDGTNCRTFLETLATCQAKSLIFVPGTFTEDSTCVESCPNWYDGISCRRFTYTEAECNAQRKLLVNGNANTDSKCGATCATNEYADGSQCKPYSTKSLEKCQLQGELYREGTNATDHECYAVDDFKTKDFGETVTNMPTCSDREFAHVAPSGDGFNCVSCNLKTFIDEYSTKRTTGKYKHGKCCRNTHHTVCHSLLVEYTSKCEDNTQTC